jgi:hypothetical protein
MLQRSTQVGEFYRMAPPKVFTKQGDAAKDLPGQYMDIVIYDEEMDKHVHITVRQALSAAMHNLDHKKGPLDGGFFGNQDFLTKKYEEAGIEPKTLATAADGTAGKTATEIADLIEKDKEWHPVEIIIARPFIEHLMMSAVIAVAGRDTGATLFGPADMLVDSEDRTHMARPPSPVLPPDLGCACAVERSQADLRQHLGQDHRGCAY